MPKVVNNLNRAGTVLVEHSDERLAAVEEAKRTGQELQSIGAKGADIVNRDVLREAVFEVSNANSSDPAQPLPDYLATLVKGVEDEQELNKQKAQEHNEVSAEIVAVQQESAVSDAEKLRKDPKYFVKRIIANNNKLAADYSATAAQYAEETVKVSEGAAVDRARIRVESLNDPNPATSLAKRAVDKVTDISEGAAASALETKDRIIFGEESFKQQAKSARVEAKAAASEDRAQAPSKTNEPKRNEETTRKAKPVENVPQNTNQE
jgi:hypothetical protein